MDFLETSSLTLKFVSLGGTLLSKRFFIFNGYFTGHCRYRYDEDEGDKFEGQIPGGLFTGHYEMEFPEGTEISATQLGVENLISNSSRFSFKVFQQ